jgi:hypothetical protein
MLPSYDTKKLLFNIAKTVTFTGKSTFNIIFVFHFALRLLLYHSCYHKHLASYDLREEKHAECQLFLIDFNKNLAVLTEVIRTPYLSNFTKKHEGFLKLLRVEKQA